MTSFVVIMGAVPSRAGLSVLSGEPSTLQRMLDAADAPIVTVISLGVGWPIEGLTKHVNLGDTRPPLLDRVLRRLGGYRLRGRLATFPIGRLINSMGPLDQGRVFWRIVRSNPDALDALREADTAIAADTAGIKTAWLARHRGWVKSAYYDHRASGLGITFVIPSRDLS